MNGLQCDVSGGQSNTQYSAVTLILTVYDFTDCVIMY